MADQGGNLDLASSKNAREVITFQIGNYSNFVGAHYWNLQERLFKDGSTKENSCSEVLHDILYRHGLNFETGRRSYGPRVIAFDFKENVRNFPRTDETATDDQDDGIIWDGSVEKYDRGLENSNSATNSATEVNDLFWTDLTMSRFHDKSLQAIDLLRHETSEGFDHFGCGEMLFRSRKFYNEFEDRLHFFAEECDRLQGFQVFADIQNGFAGLSTSLLQDLADDYAKKSCLCFAMMPATLHDNGRQAIEKTMLNAMLSFGKYIDSDCQVIPLSLRSAYGLRGKQVEFPHISYQASSDYHTSAILASAIDTVTLPFRLADDQATDINTLIGTISSAGRKISALTMGLPIPLSSTVPLDDILNGTMDFNIPLTPDISQPESILAQSAVIRGIPTHLLKPEEYNIVSRRLSAMLQCKTNQGYICPSYVVQAPCKVDPPFPDIFKPSVTQFGCVIEDYNRPEAVKITRTSAMASLVNCEEVSKPLEVLYQGTAKSDRMNYSGFLKAGTEQVDIENCRENLKVFSEAYKCDYEL